jgi:Terpene cyclase DEP1
MSNRNPGAFWVYLAVAVIGLVGTAWFNVRSVLEPADQTFFAAWFANPSVSSLAWDLLAVASAASIFIVLEGRRLGIRWYWLYVVASFVTAVGFTFPLFLAVRERRLDRLALSADPTGAS